MRIVCWLIFLCSTAPALCGAVTFPVLEAPPSYLRRCGVRNCALRRHTASKPGPPLHPARTDDAGRRSASERTLTGAWFQVKDGSLLQLTNRNGLERVLNIGGSGSFVLGAPISVPQVYERHPTQGGERFPFA